MEKYYKVLTKKNKLVYEHIVTLHIGSKFIHPKLILAINNILKTPETLLFITINDDLDFIQLETQLYDIIHHNDIIILNIKNKGMDIGGFYMALYIIQREQIKYNYLTKLHTKSSKVWLNALLYPYLNNYELNLNIFKNNNKFLSLNNGFTTIPIDNSQLEHIQIIFMELYRIDIKMYLNLNQYLQKLFKKKKIDDHNIKKKLFKAVPCFCAGSISTYKKQLIDILILSVPLETYFLFNEGYIFDNRIDKSFPHIIERILGYLQFFINNGSI